MPSTGAVAALINSSSLLDCATGNSPGLAPPQNATGMSRRDVFLRDMLLD